MIPYPHSENLEKKRKEHTNTNIAYTINTLDTSVVNTVTVVSKTIIAITNIISTIIVSDNTISIIVTTSNIHYVISDTIYTDDNKMNSTTIKDNSFTHVNRCKDIRIHKTEDTINILS